MQLFRRVLHPRASSPELHDYFPVSRGYISSIPDLVLDLFILTLLKPKFVILPGAEGMEYLFNDYRKQLIDFLKGMVFSAVVSLPFAVIAVL